MKPFHPPTPEPPPHAHLWKAGIALIILILASGVTLSGFHDAGAITAEQFLIVMVFVTAVCAGVFISMGMERRAHRSAHRHCEEVAPPPDFTL